MIKRKFSFELELEMSKGSAEGVIFISGQTRPLSIRTFLTYILLRPFYEKIKLIAVKLHFKTSVGKISIAIVVINVFLLYNSKSPSLFLTDI